MSARTRRVSALLLRRQWRGNLQVPRWLPAGDRRQKEAGSFLANRGSLMPRFYSFKFKCIQNFAEPDKAAET